MSDLPFTADDFKNHFAALFDDLTDSDAQEYRELVTRLKELTSDEISGVIHNCCDRCGYDEQEKCQCKIVCKNCGAFLSCSDIFKE